MAEEVGIVGAEELQQHHQQTASESKEGRTEKWNEEEQTKSAKSNKDIKVTCTQPSERNCVSRFFVC
jgi:hypothetical protein